MQAACFVQNESRWVLRDEYRRLVEFRYHNLVLEPDPPFPDGLSFDLVVCRNVLIYFSQERIREAAGTFFRALAPAGWLLIGHAEHNTALFSEFEPVQFASTTAYRKEPSSVPAAVLPVAAPDIAFDLPPVLVEPARVAAIAEPAPSPAVLLGEARHLADGGKLADAAALCRRLIAQDPLNAGARLTLGLVLEHMGAVTEAAAELQKAIYADREIALAHYHLGTLRQSAGDLEAARKAFRNALEVLRPLAHDEPVAYGDGIRVSELSELARMHQETIGR
jgi:chemotaxis protein methyltransferase CheR